MLRNEGFEGLEDFSMAPNEVDTEHTHEEDTTGLVVEGFIIEKPSGNGTCNVGDTVFILRANFTTRRQDRMESKRWSAGETYLFKPKNHIKNC